MVPQGLGQDEGSRSSHMPHVEDMEELSGPAGVGSDNCKIHHLYGHRQMAGPRDFSSGLEVRYLLVHSQTKPD